MKVKIKFNCDNHANIHSQKSEIVEYNEEEWNAMTDKEKEKEVEDWALETYSYWFEEL
jgi:hypothetical protein